MCVRASVCLYTRRIRSTQYFIYRCGACFLDYKILHVNLSIYTYIQYKIHILIPLCYALCVVFFWLFVCHRTPTVGLYYFVNKTMRQLTASVVPAYCFVVWLVSCFAVRRITPRSHTRSDTLTRTAYDINNYKWIPGNSNSFVLILFSSAIRLFEAIMFYIFLSCNGNNYYIFFIKTLVHI